MTDLERKLIDDFTKNFRYGTLEFEYRNGELVFARCKETFIPPSEKNSAVGPLRVRHNGTYDEKLAKD